MSQAISTAPILAVRDLSVVFATARGDVPAVDGVSLEIRPGEILGLVGESGSGKSVTLRAILGLLGANANVSGEVLFRGADLVAMSESGLRSVRGAGVGMIFQEPMTALDPVISIGVQIEETLAAHGRGDARARRGRAIELLKLVGIPSPEARLGNYPHEFSGGMRQRAMIAIALAADPSVLLADEPTTALDVTIQDQILRLIKRLTNELGMATILVTHDLGVVAETCDRVTVMYSGRVAETAPVEAIFDAPRHAYTHALLRSAPHGGIPRTPLNPIRGQPQAPGAAPEACAFAPRCDFAEAACTQARPPLVALAADQASACLARDRLPAWRA
jgi:peptide/nickel transport system ATP-binding protein/oligopeptide transport system ATP-binding protein